MENDNLSTNRLPIEILPDHFQRLITELEASFNFLPDYSIAGLLSAVSITIGNRVQLFVKNKWIEYSPLYYIVVGLPGDVKSHAIKFMLKPLMEIDKEAYENYRTQLNDYYKSNEEDRSKPELRQQLISDFTPEAMIKAHVVNKKGIGIYVDEIAGLFNSFNRYHKGNEEEMYLTAWSGGAISKLRASEDNIRIENPHINIIGTIQPNVLGHVFAGNKLHNGFIDRFLFVYPEQFSRVRWNDIEIESELSNKYNDFIKSLYDYIEELETQQTLKMSDEAKKELYSWQNSNPSDFDFNYERGIQIKLEQYVLRLSVLVHVIDNYNGNVLDDIIEKHTIKSAIRLAEYYYNNAIKVHETFRADPYDLLNKKQKNIYDKLPTQFKTSTAIQLIVDQNLLSRRSLFTFLKDKGLFEKIERGEYKKKI